MSETELQEFIRLWNKHPELHEKVKAMLTGSDVEPEEGIWTNTP